MAGHTPWNLIKHKKDKPMEPLIFGVDLSLNHFGLVCMDGGTGEVMDTFYTHDTKKYVIEYPALVITGRMSPLKEKDEQTAPFQHRRLNLQSDNLFYNIHGCRIHFGKDRDWYVGIEGYALNSQSNSVYQTGELGGVVKYRLMQEGANFRVHDPQSIKLYGAGMGNAKKKDMRAAAGERGFATLDSMYKDVKKKGSDEVVDIDGPGTDVNDAFFIADMVKVELDLRSGKTNIADLSPEQRRIFLRVTKAYPVNLLDRPFLTMERTS